MSSLLSRRVFMASAAAVALVGNRLPPPTGKGKGRNKTDPVVSPTPTPTPEPSPSPTPTPTPEPSPTPTPTPTGPTPAGSMQSAARFYRSLGINTHPNWLSTNWGTVDWQTPLVALGLPASRGMIGKNPTVLDKMKPVFDAGMQHCTLIVQSAGTTLDKTEAAAHIAFLKDRVGTQRVCGIEGPNEFNKTGPADWADVLRDFVKWTHDEVRKDAAFASVPLIAPSIWKRELSGYQAVGDISAYVDKGCIHAYSGNRLPTLIDSGTMQDALDNARILTPSKPIWMTETGWMTGGNWPVSERAQAKYILRNYCQTMLHGVERNFLYELMDDQSNLWGICDSACRPKPAYGALRNLAGLVRDNRDTGATLDYKLGGPSSLTSLALAKSDGTFLLLLWLEVSSYSGGSDIETRESATVSFPTAMSYEVYRPTFAAAADLTGNGTGLTLEVADELTVIRLQ